MRRLNARLASRLLFISMLTMAACGDTPSEPSPAPLSVSIPAQVQGRYVSCADCTDALTVVVELPVTIRDAGGRGGTLVQLETRVVNQSRGVEIARNVRPNADVGLLPSTVPAGGTVTVDTGVVFLPPPPRDMLVVVAIARLSDGREASASAALSVAS